MWMFLKPHRLIDMQRAAARGAPRRDVAQDCKSSHNANPKCPCDTLGFILRYPSLALDHWQCHVQGRARTRLAGHVLNFGLLKGIRILDCMVRRVGYTARLPTRGRGQAVVQSGLGQCLRVARDRVANAGFI